MAETIERFPLFPLGLVLLPQELVPLHIFEERYKQMIGECLEDEHEFGILWLSDDGLKEIGCSARITRALDQDVEPPVVEALEDAGDPRRAADLLEAVVR